MKEHIITAHKNKVDSLYIFIRNFAFVCMLGLLLFHLFPFQPIVWRIGLLFLSFICIGVQLNKYKFVVVEKSMFAFGLLIIIYYFATYLWYTPQQSQFGNILCSIFPVFIFYVLAAEGAITQRSLIIFLLISTVASYFYFNHAEYRLIQATMYGESGDFTINASTAFLVIIPLLFFVRDKVILIGVSAVIIFFIIFGAKRGNIVSVAIPFYLLFRMNIKSNKSLLSEFVLIVVMLLFMYFAYYIMTYSDYLMNRIEITLEGDSSGRDVIFSNAFSTWLNGENILNLFFGMGQEGTINSIGVRAHNDWLEILVDYGLVGVVCYLSFFIALIKTAWKIRKDQQLFYSLLAAFFIWFSKSLYSMGFSNYLFSYLSMTIGIVLGLEYRQKRGKTAQTLY